MELVQRVKQCMLWDSDENKKKWDLQQWKYQ